MGALSKALHLVVGSKKFTLSSSFQVVTRQVGSRGRDQCVKQMEAEGKN